MVSKILDKYNNLLTIEDQYLAIEKSVHEINTRELRILKNINNNYESLSVNYKYDSSLNIHEILVLYNIFERILLKYPDKYDLIYVYYKNQSVGYRNTFLRNKLSLYLNLDELDKHCIDSRLLSKIIDTFFTFICFITVIVYIPISLVNRGLRII